MHHLRRAGLTALLGLTVLVPPATLVVTGADAQSGPPEVTVAIAGAATTVSGAEALKPGPARMTFTATSAKPADVTLFELNSGATEQQVLAAAAKLQGPPTPLQRFGRFALGASVAEGQGYSATLTLRQATYLVVDGTRAPKVVGRFTVGAGSSGAVAPRPDVTIEMRDFRYVSPARLPTHGTFRVTNAGRSPHFLLMLRASSPANAMKVAHLLHEGDPKDQKRVEKYIIGQYSPVGLISPGVTNDVEVAGLRPGHWVMVCFYGDARSHGEEHSKLGMERPVSVR